MQRLTDPLRWLRGNFDFDVTWHYARPDVFRLLVNEAETSLYVLPKDFPTDGYYDRLACSPSIPLESSC